MLDHEYDTMRQVEDGYWWYQILRRISTNEISAFAGGRAGLKLLDAGCGTGGTLESVARRHPDFELNGVDISPLAVEHTRSRGFKNVMAGSIEALPYEDASFDGVISLDVLYHEGLDEGRALREFYRVIKPGGFLILNLPAFDFLRGRHDVAVGGARRYTITQVAGMMQRHGFATGKIHYWNAWMFFPVLLWRQFSRLLSRGDDLDAKSDLRPMAPNVSRALFKIGLMDARICAELRIPFGTSVFSVALKPTPR